MKKRYLLIIVFAFILASALFVSIAVTPADIVVRRSDAAVVQLAAFNGTSQGWFGIATLFADLNRDNNTDIAISAYSRNLSGGLQDNVGQVYIFYGSSDGLKSYTAADANVTLNGTTPGNFGAALLADDMNNDTYIDLVISANRINLSGGARSDVGQVYVFYGSADGLHSCSANQANVTLNGTSPGYFSRAFVAKDLNGDGYKDLLASAAYINLSGGTLTNDWTGQVYIFYGSSGGLHPYTASQANVTFNGTFQSNFGYSFIADDLNNDTFQDVVIGARYKNTSGGNADYTGQVYIFYGSSDGLHSYASADANVTLNGSAVDDYLGEALYRALRGNSFFSDKNVYFSP